MCITMCAVESMFRYSDWELDVTQLNGSSHGDTSLFG